MSQIDQTKLEKVSPFYNKKLTRVFEIQEKVSHLIYQECNNHQR